MAERVGFHDISLNIDIENIKLQNKTPEQRAQWVARMFRPEEIAVLFSGML